MDVLCVGHAAWDVSVYVAEYPAENSKCETRTLLECGGGPAASTIEVAIYQALRFDFDPARAVSLAFVQITVTGCVLAVLSLLPATPDSGNLGAFRHGPAG